MPLRRRRKERRDEQAVSALGYLQLAWNELSAAIPVALHDFPSLSATALRDGLWKIEGEGAGLEIELLGAEDEIR